MAPGYRTSAHRAKLLELYRVVDRALEPFSCDGTTECCRFGITGREPYPTAVEFAEIASAMGALGLARSGGKRRLPLAGPAQDEPCPLLSDDGRCRIYASRPFGCRTFFCDRVIGPGKVPRAEIQRVSRSVAALSESFAPRDPHARPLRSWLAKPSP